MAGSTKLQELATGIANENAGYSISVPKVIVSDDKYYVLDNGQAGMTFCLAEYTMGTTNEVKEINYTLDESVIYFKECEDIQQSYASPTSSNGYACSYYAKPEVVTITETGIYQLEVNITGRDSNSSLEVYTADGTESIALFAKNSGTGVKTLNFFASGNMRIGGPYYSNKFNNSKSVDYLLVRKISTSVAKIITDAGYATYCSPYALNFEGTGLTAYIAKVSGDKFIFESVTTVPANTGVLLKGDADNYNIPMIASSKTDVTGNKLVGVTENTNKEAESVLVLMNGTNGIGFYKNTNAFTVGANTAYLPTSVAEGRTFIGFDDDEQTTGIQAVNSEKITMNGGIYNLNGQRVEKATKGLYIVNGKKTVKN